MDVFIFFALVWLALMIDNMLTLISNILNNIADTILGDGED